MSFIINFLNKTAFILWCVGMLCAVQPARADVSLQLPETKFLSDSIQIGGRIKVALVYKHKPSQEVLFPDSAYNYAPFEFVKKDFFPTRSDSLTSVDSVVYTFITFEIQPQLTLSLPVFILENGDTTELYSEEAEINLTEVIAQVGPSDSLKVNTDYQLLDAKFNYPYILVGAGGLVLLAVVILVFFRKRLVRTYRFYLMKRDYEGFVKNFEAKRQAFESQHSTAVLEDLLSIWKKYLQKLEKTPYTTLTTKEISKIFNHNRLTSSLQNFDRAIYGGMVSEELGNSINCLKETALQRYSEKQEQMRHV